MDALERRWAAVSELVRDVERLVHRHLPLLQYLRTRNQAQDWPRNVARLGTVPSLTLQGRVLCTLRAECNRESGSTTVAGAHHAVFETGGGWRKALWK